MRQREENEEIVYYCRRLGIVYDEPEKWYTLPEYLPNTHRISNYGRIKYKVTDTIYKNRRIKNVVLCTLHDGSYCNIARLLVYLKYKYMRNRYIGDIDFIDEDPSNCKLSNITAKFSIMRKDNPEWIFLFNTYCINKYGEIVNIKTGALLTCTMHKNKYKVAKLMNEEGKLVSVFIAKKVAELFIPNPYKYNFIDYKDSDKSNCRFDNIKWTYSANYYN